MTATHAGVLALAGLIAGAVNSMAGGGSLISFPALLSVGYSPLVANVTNTVALVPGYLGGSLAYRAELAGQRATVWRLGGVSLIGALVGAILLLAAPPSVFGRVVPWLILLACGLLLVQPLVKRMVQEEENAGARRTLLLLGAQFASAIYGGYFGAGLGVLTLAFLGIFLHDTLQRLNALKGLLQLIINVASAIFFALFAPVAWLPVLIMAITSLAGGHLGVQLARHMNDTLLRTIIILFGVGVALKLLLQA